VFGLLGEASPYYSRPGQSVEMPARIRNHLFARLYHIRVMAFPIRTCVVCSEEFELKPDKPGFANRCPACSEPEPEPGDPKPKPGMDADERKAQSEANEARRRAMRDLLYRKDS